MEGKGVPKVYGIEVRPGEIVENRILKRRGVVIGWDAGSADDVTAFVDSLSDEEAANLAFVQVMSDLYPVPAMMLGWRNPPPWRFREDGAIPPKTGGLYPSALAMDGTPILAWLKRKGER